MITVSVESTDKELIDAIWSLRTDNVILESSLLKAGNWPHEITAYINLAAASLVFIAALLHLIEYHKNKNPSTTKTVIKSTEVIDSIKGIVSKYEKITHIEIHEEH